MKNRIALVLIVSCILFAAITYKVQILSLSVFILSLLGAVMIVGIRAVMDRLF